MKKNLLFIVVALFVFGFFVNTASAQFQTNARRSISIGACVTESELERMYPGINIPNEYSGPASLNGMPSTPQKASELGWDKTGVWNEIPGDGKNETRFCFTLLAPNAKVYTLNGASNPLFGYLDGCTKNGHPFKNRIIVPPPQKVEVRCNPDGSRESRTTVNGRKGILYEKYDTKTNEVCSSEFESDIEVAQCIPIRDVRESGTVNGKPATIIKHVSEGGNVCGTDVEITNTVYPCPQVTGASWGSKGLGSRLPSLLELAIAAGKGAATGGLASNDNRVKAAILSGAISAADTTAMNFIFPDKNVLNLVTDDGSITVKKGKEAVTGGGKLRVVWKDGSIFGYSSQTSSICFAGAVQNGVNIATDAIIYRKTGSTTSTTVAIKNPVDVTSPGAGGTSPIGTSNGPTVPGIPCNPGRAGCPSSGIRNGFANDGVNNSVTGNGYYNSGGGSQQPQQSRAPAAGAIVKTTSGKTTMVVD